MVIAAASPPPTPTAARRHPPYKQMIVTAVESLNEKGGSSRTAISKFIAANFPDLPPAHDALLTTHIRRLRKQGVLGAQKHSYVLAGAPDPPPQAAPAPAPKMRLLTDAAAAEKPGVRKAGRPRKAGGGNGNNPVMLIFPNSIKIRTESILAALNPLLEGASPTVVVLDGSGAAVEERQKKIVQRVLAAAGKGRRGRPLKVGRGLSVKSGGRPLKVVHGGLNVMNDGQPPNVVNVTDQVSDGKRKRRPPQKLGMEPVYDVLSRKRKRGWPGNAKLGWPRKAVVQGLVDAFSGKRRPGRPAKVLQLGINPMNGAEEASTGKRKPGRPSKTIQSVLNAMNVFAEASSGKRKPGRPKKTVLLNLTGAVDASVVQPGLNMMNGAGEASSGKRKPGRPKKVVLPDLNLTNVVVEAAVDERNLGQPQPFELPDVDLTNGTTGASGGKTSEENDQPDIHPRNGVVRALEMSQETEQRDLDLMIALVGKRKPGRPKKVMNGVVNTSLGKRKLGRTPKVVQHGLNLMNGSAMRGNFLQQSTGKRKPGRPKKVPEVDDNATLLSVMWPSPGKVARNADLSDDPLPAAVNVLLGMRNPDISGEGSLPSSAMVEDEIPALLNPGLESPGNAATGSNTGVDYIPVSLTPLTEKRKPGRPRKTLPSSPSSPALLGNDSVIMQRPGIDSSRKVVGEVEIVMPNIKRPGRPPKRSKLPEGASYEIKMNVKEEE